MKHFKTLTVLALVAFLFTACGESKKDAGEVAEEVTEEVKETAEKVTEEVKETAQEVAEEVSTPNIVEVAAGNEAFSTLVTAVTSADLAGTLSSEGPFTVFAPTNDAFSKLPAGTLESLLEPGNKATLSSILTYHVVSGKYEASEVIKAINANGGTFSVTTVQGEQLQLSLKDASVVVTDRTGGSATVIIPDVAASNGVIHAIDTVVMPE